MRRYATLSLLALALLFTVSSAQAQAPVIPCTVIRELPHDTVVSTQGFFFHDDKFYESSGGYKESFLTIVGAHTYRRTITVDLPRKLFAEGIAPHGDTLRLVTWRSGVGITYSLTDLRQTGHFRYRNDKEPTEGWGLTHDGMSFILSTGTDILRYHRTDDFALEKTLEVTESGKSVRLLNELEFVEGMIYANIWKCDLIKIIDPATGNVAASIDLTPLRELITPESGVANGIAYDKQTGRLFVTGKHWDKMFEIAVPKL